MDRSLFNKTYIIPSCIAKLQRQLRCPTLISLFSLGWHLLLLQLETLLMSTHHFLVNNKLKFNFLQLLSQNFKHTIIIQWKTSALFYDSFFTQKVLCSNLNTLVLATFFWLRIWKNFEYKSANTIAKLV